MSMPSYGRYLRRTFSPARLFGGIATILLACGIVAGCTMAAGRGGIMFFVIALPMIGIGFGMIAKPYALVCLSCGAKADKSTKTVPFSINALGQAQTVARDPDPQKVDWLLRNAPLPDVKPSPYAVMQARACPCGNAGYLQITTFKFNGARPMAEKAVEEFGGEIGAQELGMMRQAAPARWAATQQHRGFDDPFPPRA
jgi:hypothetical protein